MKIEKKPNTALVPCPVVLLSVHGPKGPNIITLSWAANVCSRPPMVAVGIRPERYSHQLVKDAGEFVLNIPSEDLHEASVFAGTKSGKEHDKFHECGFTAKESSKVKAPMIEQCPINLECRTKQVVSIGTHDLFIAEVVAVHIEESILDDNGRFDASRVTLFTYLPLSAEYWTLGKRIE